jgi:hypothetical protein
MRKPQPKTLFMETTGIEALETVSQIQSILGRYGAAAIRIDYEKGEPSSMSFLLRFIDREIPFKLPCRWEAIHTILSQRRKRKPYKRSIEAQAKRVAWRQILRWVEAQLALVETGMVKSQEVFLPYMQMERGQTLYEKLEETKFKLLT